MARLIVVTPDGEQREHELRAINTLGRHPEQTVQVLDRVVSKEHALITYSDDKYWLQDIGSRNGTFVNGEQIQGRTRLQDGDTISLGGTQIFFVGGQAESLSMVTGKSGNITIQSATTSTDTAIRSRLQAKAASKREFLSESEIREEAALRADYEKLRIVFELNRAIGAETDQAVILDRILDKAFEYTNADRGVILLLDEEGVPVPSAFKSRSGEDDKVQLSQTILNEVLHHHNAILSSDATMDNRFENSHSIIMQGIRSTMCVPLMTGQTLLGMVHLDTRIAIGVFTEKDLQILTVFATQAALKISNAMLARQAKSEAIVRANLSRLLSPNLVEEVVKGSIAVDKGGKVLNATVLFTDIRGFTRMSETMEPQDVVFLLNEYFEIMVDIVFQHNGTLDKFIGDELVAVWGAPVPQEMHVEHALNAGLEMLKSLTDFNRFREAHGQDPIHVGMGINTGRLVAGYIGSSKTMSYTVIGDTVNTGSRLCSYAKPGELLVSDPVKDLMEGKMEYETKEPANLKGKSKPVPIYRVLRMLN